MNTAGRTRCRWHDDGPSGRCPGAQAFPAVREVPPFCTRHLAALEPWITTRAAHRARQAAEWIGWAERQARNARDLRQMLGDRPPRHTTTRATP